jgi:hypothetical protein
MAIPNLLLAGAPKCGTTSIYDWLLFNPEVSGGIEKEIFYLMDYSDWKCNRSRNWNKNSIDGYKRLFPKNNKVVVDGTTLTIYQRAALEYTEEFKPRVIFFVREPASRVYSNFRHHKNNKSRLSSKITFGDYLKLIKEGELFDGNTQLSNAIENSKYVKYIDKFEKIIGTENIKVYVFEEFIKKPAESMKNICIWLGINGELYDNYVFLKQNETVQVRIRFLNKIKVGLGNYIGEGSLKKALLGIYKRLNYKQAARFDNPDDYVEIEQLKKQFSESNKELSEKYNLNISTWL